MKISVFVNAYNEEHNLKELFKSLKGIDDVVLIDHESTDNTAKLAKSLGARVYTKPVFTEKVTKYEVDEFTRRFGIKPFFKEGDKIINWSVDINSNLPLLKNDWVLYIDCDERLRGNLNDIDFTGLDMIICNLNRPDKDTILTRKLFRKSRVWFTYYIHSLIIGQNIKEIFTDKITIEHIQVKNNERRNYHKACEFAFIKDNSLQMNYYLAREYFSIEEFERSIKFFRLFLESDKTSHLDRSKAYTLMSGCLWQLGKHEDSFINLFYAMREYPYYSQPFKMMANMTGMTNPQYAKMWEEFSKITKDNSPL